MTYIIQKNQRQVNVERIEARAVAKIKTPDTTHTESPELTELKTKLAESKELFRGILSVVNKSIKDNK
jgi:hypothetical protein